MRAKTSPQETSLLSPALSSRSGKRGGKMGGSRAASGATGGSQTHEHGAPPPSPFLRGRGPGVWTFCGLDSTQSQRDCITQPRVARGALPWVCAPTFSQPYGLQPHSSAAHSRHYAAAIGIDDRERDDRYNPFQGWFPHQTHTQGSAQRATLG